MHFYWEVGSSMSEVCQLLVVDQHLRDIYIVTELPSDAWICISVGPGDLMILIIEPAGFCHCFTLYEADNMNAMQLSPPC